MANYKIALQLYQSQAGDENARVNISVDGATVGDNVEVSNTDSENPTLFVYDVADLPSPAADATITVKVELLNDHYVDSNSDRNVHWVGTGYVCQNADGNYYYDFEGDVEVGNPDPATEFTDIKGFNQLDACEYLGDENGTVDMTKGWWPLAITSTYVSATISLTNSLVPQTLR